MAIDNDVLSGIVVRGLDNAETWMSSDLADQQADNLRYYFAEPFGNEKAGQSKVVTRDVLETVEGIMPELMKIFTGPDNVLEFEPDGVEDEEAAAQATDYVNYVFMKRLNGFKLLYNWFKDSLIMKNSVIKVGWATEDKVEFHSFDNITQEDLDIFIDAAPEEELEIVELEENEDDTFRVRVKRVITAGEPYIEHIPSEEFRIKERSKCIQDSDFVGHVTDKTVGEMIEAGFDPDDLMLEASQSTGYDGSEQIGDARFSDPQEGTSVPLDASNESMDKVLSVADVYVRTFDEDEGRVVIMHVIQSGTNVLHAQEVDHIPLINLSPIMMPHKFTGVAVADLVSDLQEIRSTLMRQILDNLALQNAGRYAAVEGQVNLQDLLDNKIGGVVRMKSQNAVTRLDTPQLSQLTIPVMESLELQKEGRTGVSRMTQGLDPNALTSNTAATSVNQIMTAAQGKILLIARVFAETGVKELFWELYEQLRTHRTEADVIKLRGRYVEVTPFDWRDRKDMTVTVGIGNGNKDQQLFHLNNMATMFQQIGSTEYSYLIAPENVYALASEFVKNAGYNNVDRFVSNPAEVEPPPPQPDPLMVEAQAEQAKVQADAQKSQAEIQLKMKEQELKEKELQLDIAKFEWQKKIDAAELQVEVALDRPVGIGDGK
jgi:hypothetical protein